MKGKAETKDTRCIPSSALGQNRNENIHREQIAIEFRVNTVVTYCSE